MDFSAANPQWVRIGFIARGKLTPSARLQELKSAETYLGKVLTGAD